MSDAAHIKTLGWRQGSVLPAEFVAVLADHVSPQCLTPADTAWLVVVSQDCDLVHCSYDAEPFVELVVGRPIDSVDPVKMHGRNPRLLHLVGHAAEETMCLAFSVHEKVRVSRASLAARGPCSLRRIDADDVDTIAGWLAKRYTRAAFPDAFNARLLSAHKKIDKALKKSGELVTGIFLGLSSWEELPDGQTYEVILRATVRKQDLRVASVEKELAGVVSRLAQAMNTCEAISVIDADLVSESEFTLHDLRYFQRWDFDFRTRSGEPGGPIAPA